MNYLKWLLLSGFMLSIYAFQCNLECYDSMELQNWSAQWVDNSGKEPQTVEGPAPKNAFGIRLKADPVNQVRGSSDDSETCFPLLVHPFTDISLITLDGFDTIPAQTDISDRFMLRYSTKTNLEYISLNNALSTLSELWEITDNSFRFDLLMVDPPSQPGNYRFSVQLRFDTLGATVNRDTLLILPTVTLQ
ncbi:MAG TPA: hypothetical protein VK168_01985 [Saprospiraceae bacterium]|nr:hypothetical protein [Saprospiraceae bacterium]